ncbi:MAG: protein-disulfide reductase DsbD domain-containing protein [Hyphomicrobiales bacterium]
MSATVLAASLAVSLLLGASPADAAVAAPRATATTAPHVAASLLSESASIRPGRPSRVGIRLVMDPGWHTYWKNPGDSGLATRVTWHLPPGFSAGPIEWPPPERIVANTLVSYGYTGDVVLPVRLAPPARIDADSVVISATVDWLECAEACTPGSAEVRLALPVRDAPPAPGPDQGRFEAVDAQHAELHGMSLAAAAESGAVALSFDYEAPLAPDAATLFVDRPLVVDYDAPQALTGSGGRYRLRIPTAANAPGPPERLTGMLVLRPTSGPGTRVAIPVDVPVAGVAAASAAAAAGSTSGIPWRTIFIVIAGLAVVVAVPRFMWNGTNDARLP